jgi:hypothetical protein
MAYLNIEPPDSGDNYRTAMILSQITNMSGKSLAKGKTVKPEDFLGRPPEKDQTADDQKAFFMSLRGEIDG